MTTVKRIALIAKYFGKPNDYLKFWFFSASNNPTIDFLFLTDDPDFYAGYRFENIKFIKMGETEFAKRVLEHCPGVTNLKMKGFGYHCNQFRPLFGLMFSDYLEGYDYWGYVDTDVVFGDIRSFYADDLLCQYDKFLERGHFTLYRNDPEVNSRYLRTTEYCRIDYKKMCKTSLNYGFDEMHGINKVYEAEHLPTYSNFGILLDCDIFRDDLTPVQKENPFFGRSVWLDYACPKLFCVDANGGPREEILDAHVQKRKIALPEPIDGSHFFIAGNRVSPSSCCDEKEVEKIARKKNPAVSVLLRKLKMKIKSIPRYIGLIWLFMKG